MHPDDEDELYGIPATPERPLDDPDLDSDSEAEEDEEESACPFVEHDLTEQEEKLADRLKDEIADTVYLQLHSKQGWLCEVTSRNGWRFIDASYAPFGDPLSDEEAKTKALGRCLQKLHQAMGYAGATEKMGEPE